MRGLEATTKAPRYRQTPAYLFSDQRAPWSPAPRSAHGCRVSQPGFARWHQRQMLRQRIISGLGQMRR
jgi:hypothetical protein